jgi:hypothetical protein
VLFVAVVAVVADVAGKEGRDASIIPGMQLPCSYMLAPPLEEIVDVVGAKEDETDCFGDAIKV